MSETTQYGKLTPRLMLQLAAPHSWPAAIMPVFLATALGYWAVFHTQPELSLLMLVIVVLMQTAANALNDHYDFLKGADYEGDGVEEDDAVLVYNNVDPKSVKVFAYACLGLAFLVGIPIIIKAGLYPLGIAVIGALIVALYSAGKTPLSYLPLGELVSGFTMGGLIPFASVYVLTYGFVSFATLMYSIPTMIAIALIMLTNNTCDIEKDTLSGRRTLGVILGRKKSVFLYRILLIAWNVSIVSLVCFVFVDGAFILPFMVLAELPFFLMLWKCPFTTSVRGPALGQILALNVILGAFYSACILF